MSAPLNVIPLQEIAHGATVRAVVIDGVQHLCLHYIVLAMCDDQLSTAKIAWCSMSMEKRVDVILYGAQVPLPGNSGDVQLVIWFENALKLLAWLPCKRSQEGRDKVAEILIGHYAGEGGLLREVYADTVAESGGPRGLSIVRRVKKTCDLVYNLLWRVFQPAINFVNVRTPWRYPFW
jgi:hypothetical protein